MMHLKPKKILFLCHRERYDTLNCFMNSLSVEMENLGIETEKYECGSDAGYSEALLSMLTDETSCLDAVFTMNAGGQENWEYEDGNLWEHFKVPFVNYIVDHPVDHQRELKSPCRCQHVICVDPDHVSFIHDFFPNIASVHFLSLPGYQQGDNRKGRLPLISERDTGLVFTGSLDSLAEMERSVEGYPPHLRKMTVMLIDHLLAHRDETYETAHRVIMEKAGFAGLSNEERLPYLIITRIALRYARAFYREEVIRHLAVSGLPFHIYGSVCPELMEDLKESNVRICPGLSYSETARLYTGSKLVLNVMPLFKKGCHDRIPTALLNGAVPVTDHSEMLDEPVWKDKCIFYSVSRPEEVPGIIKEALSDEGLLQKRADSGRAYVKANHTWADAASFIADIIGNI